MRYSNIYPCHSSSSASFIRQHQHWHSWSQGQPKRSLSQQAVVTNRKPIRANPLNSNCNLASAPAKCNCRSPARQINSATYFSNIPETPRYLPKAHLRLAHQRQLSIYMSLIIAQIPVIQCTQTFSNLARSTLVMVCMASLIVDECKQTPASSPNSCVHNMYLQTKHSPFRFLYIKCNSIKTYLYPITTA